MFYSHCRRLTYSHVGVYEDTEICIMLYIRFFACKELPIKLFLTEDIKLVSLNSKSETLACAHAYHTLCHSVRARVIRKIILEHLDVQEIVF